MELGANARTESQSVTLCAEVKLSRQTRWLAVCVGTESNQREHKAAAAPQGRAVGNVRLIPPKELWEKKAAGSLVGAGVNVSTRVCLENSSFLSPFCLPTHSSFIFLVIYRRYSDCCFKNRRHRSVQLFADARVESRVQ